MTNTIAPSSTNRANSRVTSPGDSGLGDGTSSNSAAHDAPDDALTKFGARVRELRKARGLTQHALAESAGIDRKTVNRIENTRYSPTLTNVFAIAEALHVPANRLL